MLLQSQNGSVELLPALPSVWKSGEVKGWLPGGFVVDMKWENSQLVSAQIYSKNGGSCLVKYKEYTAEITNSEKGKIFKLNHQLIVN